MGFFSWNVRCTASYFVKLYDAPVGFVTPPPPNLRVCIVLFVAAEGWLLLDIGWFVVFLITMFVSKIVIGQDRHTFDRKTTLYLSWTQSFFWCSCDLRWLILNPLINLEKWSSSVRRALDCHSGDPSSIPGVGRYFSASFVHYSTFRWSLIEMCC